VHNDDAIRLLVSLRLVRHVIIVTKLDLYTHGDIPLISNCVV